MFDIYNTIVGTASLIFSIIGYCASKKASKEAKAAKEEAAIVKKMIEKTNYVRETRLDFQENLDEACKEEQRINKAAKLLSILQRIQTRENEWNTQDVNYAIADLNKAISHLSDEQSYYIGDNTKAIAKAEGITKAYIDQLSERITEMTAEQPNESI